jgi:predicted Rossmann-fold nucleotide-binding protein
VQTRKVTRFPVILFGERYWSGLLDWIRDTVLPEAKIGAADLELIRTTSDVEEAVSIIVEADAHRSAQEITEKAAQAESASAGAGDGQ